MKATMDRERDRRMFMRRLATFVDFIFLDDYLGMDVLVTVNCLSSYGDDIPCSIKRAEKERGRERKLEIMS